MYAHTCTAQRGSLHRRERFYRPRRDRLWPQPSQLAGAEREACDAQRSRDTVIVVRKQSCGGSGAARSCLPGEVYSCALALEFAVDLGGGGGWGVGGACAHAETRQHLWSAAHRMMIPRSHLSARGSCGDRTPPANQV